MEKSNTCPKCKYSKEKEFDTCPSCGLIIKRYYEIEERKHRQYERLNKKSSKEQIIHNIFTKLLCVTIILLSTGYWFSSKDVEISHPPGIIAEKEPLQLNTDAESWVFNDHSITPLAKFALKARVLGKERYYFGRESELSKYDLALGWQEMSDSKVLNRLSISQSRRWYWWKWKGSPLIPARQIPLKSANMHIIAGNADVEKALEHIAKDDIINLEGYLIKAKGKDGWRWKSSLSRSDTGNHSCEVVWVEKLSPSNFSVRQVAY